MQMTAREAAVAYLNRLPKDIASLTMQQVEDEATKAFEDYATAKTKELQKQLEGWRKAASPVTDNPQEEAFYEKAEASLK